MEAISPGTEMRDRTNYGVGAHDFDLYRAGRLVASVEVTASVDQELDQTLAAINDKSKGSQSVPAQRCKLDWWVHPLPRARIDRLREKIDDYLSEVEAEGVGNFFSWVDAGTSPAVSRIFHDLQVECAQVARFNPPGQIRIVRPGGGGPVNAIDVQRSVEVEAAKSDNRKKLRASGLDERHLFVYVEPTHYLPWKALVREQPPESAPALPDEITRVWAAAASCALGEFVVWSAERGQRWEAARLVTLSQSLVAEILTGLARQRPKTGLA